MKTLDTLIHDIYTVLDGLNCDKGIDIPEDLMEEFLVNMREALEGWSTPHLQSKEKVLQISQHLLTLVLLLLMTRD